MSNTNNDLFDILGAIELPEEILNETNKIQEKKVTTTFNINTKAKKEKRVKTSFVVKIQTKNNSSNTKENLTEKKENKFLKQFYSSAIFGLKYITTSVAIFGVLLVSTNFSAYSTIVKSYVFKNDTQKEEVSLLNSVNADQVEEKKTIHKKTKKEILKEFEEKTIKKENKVDYFNIKKIIANTSSKNIDLGINIVPYENRIVIPKIAKNIPLIDIKEKKVKSKNKLENIFMKELESGIVRYPGSARPWEKWNVFIFGHSSNYPWIAGKYNDVFARLGQLKKWDIIYSYYWQKKYKYQVISKKVIKPTDVWVLKNDKTKKELTLMTCWPIGTDLNRLIVTTKLIED